MQRRETQTRQLRPESWIPSITAAHFPPLQTGGGEDVALRGHPGTPGMGGPGLAPLPTLPEIHPKHPKSTRIQPKAPRPASPGTCRRPAPCRPRLSFRGPGKLIPVTPLPFQVTAGAVRASLSPGTAPVPVCCRIPASPQQGKRAPKVFKAPTRAPGKRSGITKKDLGRKSFLHVSLRC